MSAQPVLSVLITAGDIPARAAKCLDAVFSQEGAEHCEVILADVSAQSRADFYLRWPGLKYLHVPDAPYMAESRVACLEASSAPLVAFLEDHTVPEPGWLNEILAVFERQQKVAVINYGIRNSDPSKYVTRCYHLIDYGPWADPAIEGPIEYACHHNLAYRRHLLVEELRGDAGLLEAEYLVHRRLMSKGWTLWLAASAIIRHETWQNAEDGIEANGSMKRLIAHLRAGSEGWQQPRRWAYAFGMVLCPPLLVWRIARTIIPRPGLWGEFLYCLPLIAYAYCRIAVNEAFGYVAGPGDSKARFAHLEYGVERR
ncbi:MAG: glycosyltransferase [Acidobacteria bacterium]|nr:glycosyltransferase [Acidobacteriota bacterium]